MSVPNDRALCACRSLCIHREIEQGYCYFLWEEPQPLPSCAHYLMSFCSQLPYQGELARTKHYSIPYFRNFRCKFQSLFLDFFLNVCRIHLIIFYFLTFLFSLNHLRVQCRHHSLYHLALHMSFKTISMRSYLSVLRNSGAEHLRNSFVQLTVYIPVSSISFLISSGIQARIAGCLPGL